MLFELSKGSQSTHAGVLEFIAEEERVYLPHWVGGLVFHPPWEDTVRTLCVIFACNNP